MPLAFLTPKKDVYIASAFPDINFNNHKKNEGDFLFVGTFTGADDIFRSLLQFDLFDPGAGIPSNRTIQEAVLFLHLSRNDNAGVAQVYCFRLFDSFNANEVTFNTVPMSHFPISDFAGGAVTPAATPISVALNITSLVQSWYLGLIPNNGIELRGIENGNNNILGFRSTRFTNRSFWPSLVVNWA